MSPVTLLPLPYSFGVEKARRERGVEVEIKKCQPEAGSVDLSLFRIADGRPLQTTIQVTLQHPITLSAPYTPPK